MSIKSQTFGGVILTEEDAAKFKRQITYGRPGAAARRTARRGAALARKFRKDGKLVLIVKGRR